jgi:2-oxoglutarate dehydrogenase E2 component (dihydrolipoamide succinyltransferase)
MSIEVRVPTLGESVTEATIATWFKKPGDKVAVDEMLCELETDKVTVEVPSPAAGTLGEIIAGEGSTVGVNALLATIAEGAGAAPAEARGGEDQGRSPRGRPNPPPRPRRRRTSRTRALRSKKAVDGRGRPLPRPGRGHRPRRPRDEGGCGRAPPPRPHHETGPRRRTRPDPPRPRRRRGRGARGAGEDDRLRQTIARRLKDAQNTAAMLTTYNEVDMTGVMDLRNEYKDLFEKKHGVKLGFMSFFAKACIHALKEVPEVNAEIDGTDVVYKNFVHMGIAVGTPSGLVVPVVRDADQMGFAAIEKKIAELGIRARDGKLSMAEMQGGTFTISNGGVYGSSCPRRS